jgi:hypothetical protein
VIRRLEWTWAVGLKARQILYDNDCAIAVGSLKPIIEGSYTVYRARAMERTLGGAPEADEGSRRLARQPPVVSFGTLKT